MRLSFNGGCIKATKLQLSSLETSHACMCSIYIIMRLKYEDKYEKLAR